jgi:predicted porin
LTFLIGKNEITLYGHADVSIDYVNPGLSGAVGAVGNTSWAGQVSSNLSYFGVRGMAPINDDLKGVFQFETEIAYAATPGGTSDNSVKTGLGSRNSFVGLQSARFGAIKAGKTDAPYKLSTARMDPFQNSIGDYNSIMGNTGGDPRVEFDTRLPHAFWYESPNLHGWTFTALISPGQNLSSNNSIAPQGEPVCAGQNNAPCNNGGFGTAYSTSLTYEAGPLYAISAYELHKNVNRSGTEKVGIADEYAFKFGAQYTFAKTDVLSFIWERTKRKNAVAATDMRSRDATWLALTHSLTPNDELNFGWAHAFRSPGNSVDMPANIYTGLTATGPVDTSANLFSVGYKHRFDKRKSVYVVASEVRNGAYAHYPLGASGHGIVNRSRDGAGNDFSGNTIKGISVGMIYDF